MPDLGSLKIEHVIIHDVPKHRAREQGPKPTLSETESPLTTELANYLRERVIDSMALRSLEVEFDPAAPATVRDGVTKLMGATPVDDLVGVSHAAAGHLHTVQTGANPSGLLVVFVGKLNNKPAVGVMKLEREEALLLDQGDVGGKKTFELQHLRDLVLNKGTRVFKSGLFYKQGTKVVGIARDEQRGYFGPDEVAHFFLRTFLGCKQKEEPSVTTKRFYDTVEKFVREDVDDPETKSRYTIAAHAVLNSGTANVTTRDFARQNIDEEDRDAFERRLVESSVPPTFSKDVDRIKTRLRNLRMDFDEEISLIASPKALEETITTEERDGKLHVEFDGTLKDVRGK
jgi:hypothetical protein